MTERKQKVRKCKDCKLFKNGCGFSQTDEQLGLNGDFVACGQFIEKNNSGLSFEICQHRKEVDVYGVKKKSLFCDFDDIECDISDSSVCRNQGKL